MSGDEPIIELEKGFDMVKKQGIDPFLKLIDTKDGTALKAKEFISVYDIIFKMCIQRDPYNWSEQMYQRYDQSIAHYLLHSVAPKLNEARTAHDVAFLREWTLRWNNHKLIVKGLSQLFMYLDRFYTKNTDGILQLRDQGFAVFKDNIFDQFSDQARICVLNAIEKERNSEEQDRHLLSEAVNVFVEMGMNYGNKKLQLYKNALENKIVEAAGAFYKRQSRIWLDQDSAPNYLIKAEKMLASEKARVESYLNRCTLEPLIRECYVQLLKTHQKALLEKKTGVDNMLTLNATEDLSRLYRLYSKYPADLDMIGDMVHDHIDKAGARIVSEAQESAKKAAAAAEGNIGGAENHDLVTRLIALHDQYAKVVNNCFEKSPVFQKALKKAFETFINADDRVSNLLAQYVNEVLKRGSKVHVDDVESTLDHIVFLYGYIHDKDMFERSYQIFLAHRLLMGLCESEHSEKSMIAKLKTESGYQWTNKLEGMFKDVQLSKELMTKFANVFEAKKTLDFQLEVNVCTTSYWPSSKKLSANLPKDLTGACDKYKRFYLNQHSGHKLQWRLDQGQAEVMVIFSAKARHALVLSTYQMMILLIFNETPTVNFKTVLDITGLPDYEIGHHLLSMCHPKVGVILKRPNNRQLAEDHQFKINPKYMNKLKKVIIPTMKPPEVDDKKKKEEEKLKELQRRHQMDAAIVRIMKTRKTLRHNQLVSEVVSQLKARFVPKPANIKKRIEALIEQEYLERSKDDRSMYNYLA